MAAADPWARLDELFRSESDLFLPAVRQESEGFRLVEPADVKKLAAFADRWKVDARPWARKQLLAYLDLPMNRGGHHAVVRRIFKHAEAASDHEILAACLTLFDRGVRRHRKAAWGDAPERLAVLQETIPAKAKKRYNPKTRKVELRFTHAGVGKLYTAATRAYLRRRAWRYFRNLGRKDPAAYVAALVPALRRYVDKDLPRGESLLDCWGLVHALFGKSPELTSGWRHVNLAKGGTLGKLAPAPYFPEAWRTPEAGALLEGLVFEARASLVRRWAGTMLQIEHPQRIAAWKEAQWVRLLRHDDPQTQAFALEQLRNRTAEPRVAAWFPLLAAAGPATEAGLCELARKQVDVSAAVWDDLLAIASLPQVGPAGLGLEWLMRAAGSRADLPLADKEKLARLAEARCPLQTEPIVTWALDQALDWGLTDPGLYCAFFDARANEVRQAALQWWTAHPAVSSPEWFVRLLENPYDDVKFHLLQRLETERRWATEQSDLVAQLWTSVLFNVARGSRQKPKAIQQIGEVLRSDPERAPALLPALSAAVRSVRGSESRLALSALVSAAEQHESIREWIQERMPELELSPSPQVVSVSGGTSS